MKISIVLLLLILSGCAQKSGDSIAQDMVVRIDTALNLYAIEASTNSPRFDRILEGDALESAIQTQELIASMGLIQLGHSSFSQTTLISADQFESCLDVSATRFVYENGEDFPIPERMERQLMRAKFVERSSEVKINLLEMVGREC
ncbi:MAG: hypothetical protein K9G13_06085 [Aquiluna sp.]|nr:hypothetical protein [Aquiluna sp.]MCF8546088.1 hypothetical protein [Aquiluna sp.]